MQKFNKFSLAVFQKESVPGFPTKKTERQTQTYSDGPQSDTRLPDRRLKSGQGYRTYTVWMMSGVALAACSGGGGGGAPAPVATISEHHTPGIEGAQAYYMNENDERVDIPGAVTDADGNPVLDGENKIELTQNSDISIRFGDYGESGSLILAKGGADNIYLHNSAVGTDTVIYQVNTDGGVAGLDGTDQIYSFQLGVDRIFFLDTNEGNTDPTLDDLIARGSDVTGMSMNFILQTSDNPGDDTPVSSIWINFGSGTDLATVEFWPSNALTVAEIETIFSDLNLVLEDDDTIPINTVLNKDDASFTAENLEELFGVGNIEVISMDQLHEGDDDLQLYAVPADIL